MLAIEAMTERYEVMTIANRHSEGTELRSDGRRIYSRKKLLKLQFESTIARIFIICKQKVEMLAIEAMTERYEVMTMANRHSEGTELRSDGRRIYSRKKLMKLQFEST